MKKFYKITMNYEIYNLGQLKAEYFSKDKRETEISWYFKNVYQVVQDDIIYIYCCNMPDSINRFIMRAVVKKSVLFNNFDEEEKKKYKCYRYKLVLNNLEAFDEKEANDKYRFSKEQLKSDKYNFLSLQGSPVCIDDRYNDLVNDLENAKKVDVKRFLDEYTNEDCFFKNNDIFNHDNENNHLTFQKNNGLYYVEYHHIIQSHLSSKGSDKSVLQEMINCSENYIRLCPNCHRRIHYAKIDDRRAMLEFLVNKIDNKRKGKLDSLVRELQRDEKNRLNLRDYLYKTYGADEKEVEKFYNKCDL